MEHRNTIATTVVAAADVAVDARVAGLVRKYEEISEENTRLGIEEPRRLVVVLLMVTTTMILAVLLDVLMNTIGKHPCRPERVCRGIASLCVPWHWSYWSCRSSYF